MTHISKAEIKQIRSLQHKKFRDELHLFVAEGEKCVGELRKRYELVRLVTSDNATEQEIEQMSSLRTPQGVIGVFRLPEQTLSADCLRALAQQELCVALDGVQDPGNLGTIIRTCDWFGVRHIFCSCDTADCYNSKVVQATMGALARVQVHYTDLLQVLTDAPIYGTLLEGKEMYLPDAIQERQHGIIIMGNEGNGISSAVRRCITHPLRIPSYPADAETSESLNVAIATAITLSEFRRPVHLD